MAAAALVVTVASAILTVAGARRRDGRTVLLGTAFSTMTALLAVHGLATPGVLAGPNGVVALAGAASLPAGALVLAISALPGLRPIRTWQLTRRPGDLVTVVGIAWLGLALVAQMTISFTQLAFYVGHGLELAGVIALGVPAALDLHRGAASLPLVGDLGATELVAEEEAFLGARVSALVVRLGEKDAATEGHTRRVAMLAVQVGEAFGLPRGRLRLLALGGLLHDMGKLSVPCAVLTKPGPLDDSELAEIREHPEAGECLLRDLGGFAPGVLRLVLDHHERLDGSGHPRGLAGEELDTETRILAVCDVYDALVSDRVYRAAWTQERAIALLRDASQFDQRCVAALESVLEPPFVVNVAPAPVVPARAFRPTPRQA